jgi:hypothetical protein
MSGAKIIPFSPRPKAPQPSQTGAGVYFVRGRFERHKRDFMVHAVDLADAIDVGQSLLNFYALHSSGTYGPLVWQRGEIVLEDFDGNVVAQLNPCPKPLVDVNAPTKKTTRKKKQ